MPPSARSDGWSHLAFQGGQHHMGRIQAMNEVWWERGGLFHRVHRGRSIRIRDVDSLDGRGDLLSLYPPVRLNDRKSEGSRPDDSGHLFILDPVKGGNVLRTATLDRKCGKDPGRWNGFRDEPRTKVEPGLNILGSREQVPNAPDNLLCQVRRGVPALFFGDIFPFLQLPLNLVPCTDECDTVHSRHDGLLDDLSGDLSVQHDRVLDVLRSFLLHLLLDHGRDVAVHVGGTVRSTEVDLLCALSISTEGGVVLETVAGAILMDRKVGLICERIWRF